MNCPNFIKNLSYFSTTDAQFVLDSNLVIKEIFTLFRFVFPVVNEHTRDNLIGLIMFPDSYCYFLRYLCHLRLGNIQRSNEEFSNMERVEFIGSEQENIRHRITMVIMKYINNLRINQTYTNLETEAINLTYILEKI